MPTLEELLGVGAHFGHRVSRWNPKMAPYIFTTRNKFHIIDLDKTLEKLKTAADYVSDVVSGGGLVLFVGTKRQAKPIIKKYAKEAGMPFVAERWLGGSLTNFKTIQRSIRKLDDLEKLVESPEIENYTKKERLMMEREINKNRILFEGIRNLKKLPDALFVLDSNIDKIAVEEARVVGVPVIGIADTNSDPGAFSCLIPANDDSIKTLDLITKIIGEAAKHKIVNPEDSKTE